MDDEWDDGPAVGSVAPQSFGSDYGNQRFGSKGRGFTPEDESNGFANGNSFGSGRGGRGGGRGGSRGGDRGGRGGRGGGGRFGDDREDRGGGGRRDGDWTCPNSDCGNSNFAFRTQCQKCDTDKPNDGGDRFGGSRGGGRGGRRYNNDSDDDDNSGGSFGGRGGGRGRGRGGRGGSDGGGDGRREGDWICPDSDCGNSNFGWRKQCQKCDTDKPAGLGGDDKPKTELYIPPEPTDDDEVLYGSGISSGINFEKYNSIKINVTGKNCPPPITDFSNAGLRPFVLDNIKKSGYKTPTPVQKHAIPIIMAGRDLMACAQTGSGKTAAFLIPIINTLLERPSDLVFEGDMCEPQAVIVSPTRELAIQIFDEARKFARGSILKINLVYGGTAVNHQASKFLSGCHILVATPGRLNDFVGRGRIRFGSIRFFILDEADRMLDMGFIEDMKKMLHHESMVGLENRQTLMFSATFPSEIQALAAEFLNNYIFAAVGIVGGACSDVEQVFFQVSRHEKREKLKELLSSDDQKVLVFVETKRNADFTAIFLSELQIPTTSIHGDRLQRERETALNDFKYNRMRVLVATAVAARGLDIKGVAHVINYDMPKTIQEYVHRIGRTGRVGNRGRATSFFDAENDRPLAADLVKILQQAGQDVPDWLDSAGLGGSGGSGGSQFGGRDYRNADSFNSGPLPVAGEEDEAWD